MDGMEKEGQIYALLESKGVPNIAPFGKGNDVRNHEPHTFAQRRCMGMLVKGYGGLRQYRMSLDVVARPLTSFRSSHEFVSAIADAMEGKTSFADSDI